MIAIIDDLFPFLYISAITSFIVFFILGGAYKLNNLGQGNILNYFKKNVYFRVSAILTIISFILIFGLSSYVSKLSRDKIRNKIESIDSENFTLIVNQVIEKNDSLIVALKKIKKTTSNRNTGSTVINVKIIQPNETIRLLLLRDFNTKTKYWVHNLSHKVTSVNCIGEINTESLNKYK